MARYIIERNVGQLPADQLKAVGQKSAQEIKEMGSITWVRSWVSIAEGKIYCEYVVPNPEAIQEHARRTGIPADKISLVTMELDPTMFM